MLSYVRMALGSAAEQPVQFAGFWEGFLVF